MLNHMNDTVDDLEELLTDASLGLDTTAIQPGQVVYHLDTIVSQGTLQPLQHIEETSSVIAQVHGKVDEMKAS